MRPAAQAATWPTIGGGRLPLRRVLVVQTQRLGDVVCATPLFTALRRQFPQAHLAALVHAPHQVLLEANPEIDEVLTYDRQSSHRSLVSRFRLISELRAREYDWVLSIHAASSVAFALVQAGIPWRTCVYRFGDHRKPHWAHRFQQAVRQTREAAEKHEIEYNLDVLRELGFEPRHEGGRLFLRDDERAWARQFLRDCGRDESRPLAVIHPGHGGGRQSWPPGEYARVGDALVERGFQVAVTGSPGERDLAVAVASGMRSEALMLAGRTNLRQLCGVLENAALFVSVSTGPMHLASVLKVPCVLLCGPTDLRSAELVRFSPYRSPFRPVLSSVPCVCASSHRCVEPVCMTGIAAAAVIAAAEELMAGRPEGRRVL